MGLLYLLLLLNANILNLENMTCLQKINELPEKEM